jgi:hypothetical protein
MSDDLCLYQVLSKEFLEIRPVALARSMLPLKPAHRLPGMG